METHWKWASEQRKVASKGIGVGENDWEKSTQELKDSFAALVALDVVES